jgi:hypothetical protein
MQKYNRESFRGHFEQLRCFGLASPAEAADPPMERDLLRPGCSVAIDAATRVGAAISAFGRLRRDGQTDATVAFYTLLPLHFSFCLTTLKNDTSGITASGKVRFALRIMTTESISTRIGSRPSTLK